MKVAVVGVGNMGKNHARVYSELKGVELVGVVDLDEKVGKEIANRFNAEYFSDYKDILDKVDAVSIVVPTKYHFQVAKDFLDAGVDVLLEKPISVSLEEADGLIEAADKNNRILQIGHIERFNSAVMQIRDYLGNEDIIHLEAVRTGTAGSRITDAGVVLDLMIHDIDIILDLVGGEVTEIKANATKVSDGHEDFAEALLSFKNGTLARLVVSRTTQKRERLLKITQKDRYILVNYMDKTIEIHKQAESKYVTEDKNIRLIYSDVVERPHIRAEESLKLELQSFVDCVKDRKTPLVDGVAGKRALEVALKVLERSR